MTRTIERIEDRLADFTQDSRILILSGMALGVGAISMAVAAVLIWLIGGITNLAFYQRFSSSLISPQGHHLGCQVILLPVVGGLIIGGMARYGSEKIRGHGIPEALEAILIGRSRMEARVALLKPLSSAISIGTGGPFGAEGPIIMTGASLGSLFAQFFHLTSAERKTLLVAGAAGGMSAIFASPVAAVLLAVELLLFEWKPRSFVPVAVASVTAGALRAIFMGTGPIFPVAQHAPMGSAVLFMSLMVGIVAGLGSGLLTALVYAFEDLFLKLPIHWMWWPAIGGLFVGVGGFIDPRVLGVGYETIHGLLRGDILGGALVGLLVGKALVWSIALGSGTSGGVLAPLLILGGALGAFEARWIPVGDPGLWAMVSMAAMMGGTMRSPLTAMIFIVELTHDFNALTGLMVGCVAAYAVTVLLLRRSILTEKLARRGHHISREYSVDPFMLMRVGEVMDINAPRVLSTMKVAELSERIARRERELIRRQGTLIVNEQGKLCGIITRGDMVRALDEQPLGNQSVLEAGSQELIVAYPDELLHDALSKMAKNNVGRLPVVQRNDSCQIVGYLGRSSLLEARMRRLEEEHIRETRWARHKTVTAC